MSETLRSKHVTAARKMVQLGSAVWTDSEQAPAAASQDERPWMEDAADSTSPAKSSADLHSSAPAGLRRLSEQGWCLPSTISSNPDEARAGIPLPPFGRSLVKQ